MGKRSLSQNMKSGNIHRVRVVNVCMKSDVHKLEVRRRLRRKNAYGSKVKIPMRKKSGEGLYYAGADAKLLNEHTSVFNWLLNYAIKSMAIDL